MVVVAMLWRVSTFTKNVPAAGTKRWEMTLVSKANIVICVIVFRTLRIRKDKKAGTLVSPSKVTVVGPVDDQTDFEMVPDAAHAQERVITGSSPTAFGQASVRDSTPKMPGSTIQAPISDTPFINPSPDPGATGPVRPPGQELEVSPAVKKHKGKSKQKKAFKPAHSLQPSLQESNPRIQV